jgi:hypothetical protein
MSVKCEIIVEPAYVCLRCTGTCSSLSELTEVFWNAIKAIQEHPSSKVLIDANNVEGQLSTLDRYEGASFLSEHHISGPVRITAIAIAGQEPLIDPDRFGETVARNRGVNGRVFTDLDEAVAWLTSVA